MFLPVKPRNKVKNEKKAAEKLAKAEKKDSDNSDDKKECKRRRWSPEEDRRLASIVEKHSAKNWSKISLIHGTRDGKQCRERWVHHLSPDVDKSPLSDEECALLIKMQAIHGNKWSDISAMMPGRTAGSIKNFWNSTVAKAKRTKTRKPHGEGRSYATNELKKRVEQPLRGAAKGGKAATRGKRRAGLEAASAPDDREKHSDQREDELGNTRATGENPPSQGSPADNAHGLCLLGEYDKPFLEHLNRSTGMKFFSLSLRDIDIAMRFAECTASLRRGDDVHGCRLDENG